MYSSNENTTTVISRPRHDFVTISEWFYKHFMILTADNCHFLTIGFNELHAFVYKQHFYKQCKPEIGKKKSTKC